MGMPDKKKPDIQIRRVYEVPQKSDGVRILVDRLWPRGVKKEEARLDEWNKEIAPSAALRKWFDHDPKKWPEFNKRYTEELKANTAVQELLKNIMKVDTITLLYAAHDQEHNNAVVLRDHLLSNL
jgi:uncharacterized protein YeaO (DUF488 family)